MGYNSIAKVVFWGVWYVYVKIKGAGAQWARMNAKCAKTGFPHVQCTGSDQLLTCTQASRPGYCVHCISIVRSAREWLKLIKIYENLA